MLSNQSSFQGKVRIYTLSWVVEWSKANEHDTGWDVLFHYYVNVSLGGYMGHV